MLNPLLFQDDIARICDSPEAAQHGNELINHVMESKLRDYNLDKSVLLLGDNLSDRTLKKDWRKLYFTLLY